MRDVSDGKLFPDQVQASGTVQYAEEGNAEKNDKKDAGDVAEIFIHA